MAVERGRHRHPRAGAGRNRRGLALIPQLVKYDYVGGQAPHRAADAFRLGASQQYVTSLQITEAAEFSPLVHHRHTIPLCPQTRRQIPQQGGFTR